MAPKTKSRLVDQPPSASSSEEQEQVEGSQEEKEQSEEEEEESGEESEEEEPKTAPPVEKKPTTQKPVQTPQNPQSSSDPESDGGSGSESDSESGQSQPSPSASDFTVKPSVPAKAAPSKPAAKRPLETQQAQTEKDTRRKKPKIAEEDRFSEEKKSATTPSRLWSDEDQIAVLKGMAEFKAQKGTEPNADMSVFHDFIRGKLQVEVSKSQLSDKLRRLKKKFLTNVKDSEVPVFSKPHDYLVFEYSKKIWGAPGGKGDAGTSNGVKENVNNSTNCKSKKAVEVKKSSEPKKNYFTKLKDDEKYKEDEKQVAVKEVAKEDIIKGDQQDFQSKYPRLAASFESMADLSAIYPNAASLLKENMSLIVSDKAKVLEEKWKKLQADEADLIRKRLDLIAEHYRLVVDAMRGN